MELHAPAALTPVTMEYEAPEQDWPLSNTEITFAAAGSQTKLSRSLARSLVTIPSELHQNTRIFQTLSSGDIALYMPLTHYSTFLSMNVSRAAGAQLSCGGMTMVVVAEGESDHGQ